MGYQVEIRSDFKSVEMLLSRLVQYASAFNEYNHNQWSHLKNRVDFDRVYRLEWDQRGPLEAIYSDGRALAAFMSSRLVAFNNPDEFATLKKFVDSFDNGWLFQTDILNAGSQKAKDICAELENPPWAVLEMIKLYDRQIDLLSVAHQTIEGLRRSDIYKWESGEQQASYPVPEYSRILECVHSLGQMFERLPSTYAGKDEEALRDHILVSLQAVVSGVATGETFNKRGKTDILIRNGDRNEFIGECKFWRGKVVYLETITQLLSYLSWRDVNTAVIVFVQNRDFTAVVEQVPSHTAEHPQYLRSLDPVGETWHRFEFRMNEDEQRVVNISVMLYHIPAP